MSHTTIVKSVPIKSESALREAAKELRRLGIDVELVQNAVPRLYYKDQIQRTLVKDGKKMRYHSNVEECDYVLRVKKAYYDIGFLKDVEGNLVPLFDHFPYPSPYSNPNERAEQKALMAVLGTPAPPNCKQEDVGQYVIGKFLQSYSLCAATEAFTEAGYSITSSSFNSKGEIVLEVEVL